MVLFFEGEVLDKKLLGRCIIESSSHLEIFPSVIMTENCKFEVDWKEKEIVDFNIVRIKACVMENYNISRNIAMLLIFLKCITRKSRFLTLIIFLYNFSQFNFVSITTSLSLFPLPHTWFIVTRIINTCCLLTWNASVDDSILVSPQEALETWIRADEGLVVEGNTLSATGEVQSLPVCALSSENLKKEGRQLYFFMLYTISVDLCFHSLFM